MDNNMGWQGGRPLTHTNPKSSLIQSADEYEQLLRSGRYYGV